MQSLIEWLEANQMPCFYVRYFGVECPGCGMQRAAIALLKGNFIESLTLFPALLPTVFMVLFLCFHLIFKIKKGAIYLKYLFLLNTTIIIISYIIKVNNL